MPPLQFTCTLRKGEKVCQGTIIRPAYLRDFQSYRGEVQLWQFWAGDDACHMRALTALQSCRHVHGRLEHTHARLATCCRMLACMVDAQKPATYH